MPHSKKSDNWKDNDGIVHMVFLDNVNLNINDLKTELTCYKSLSKEFTPPALIDISGVLSIDSDGRKFIAEEIAKIGVPATALIVKSRMSRLIGSFFIGINKPDFPVKLFDDEQKAVEWLKGFLHD